MRNRLQMGLAATLTSMALIFGRKLDKAPQLHVASRPAGVSGAAMRRNGGP